MSESSAASFAAKSNQGGIETRLIFRGGKASHLAKSNQGGIETAAHGWYRYDGRRQNRTKVGLKLGFSQTVAKFAIKDYDEVGKIIENLVLSI